MLVGEKVTQAVDILKELDIDCWITFVRESSIMHDPMLDFLIEADVTWHSAFIVTKSGDTYAIVGEMERKSMFPEPSFLTKALPSICSRMMLPDPSSTSTSPVA